MNDNNELNIGKSFVIPKSMVDEIDKVVEERKYRSQSDFARCAFKKELESINGGNNGNK